MKIAIHNTPGSFSDRWIEYCIDHNINHILVNMYDNNIISKLKDCDAFICNFYHDIYKNSLVAKQLLFSLQQSGKKVFPDFNTCWHYDDKIGQKYLLESINAPYAKSYVFYSKKDALAWVQNTIFPKVFKLRGGAGSTNVRLVRTKKAAIKLIKKAFRRGFPQYDKWNSLKERVRRFNEDQAPVTEIFKGIGRFIFILPFQKMKGNEKGYVYFQEFIPNNDSDIRIIVISNKAFAIKRIARKNDFRASGSGHILYDKKYFDLKTIKMVLNIASKLKSQCCAFDIVYNEDHEPVILEISYGFTVKPYDSCVGYWDDKLNFHKGSFNPCGWMIEDLLSNNKH